MGPYRVALQTLFRNGRRTITTILGILLAVSFVSGALIAIDSSSRSALDALLEQRFVGDFVVRGKMAEIEDVTDDLLSVPGVTDLTPWAILDDVTIVNASEGSTSNDGAAADPSNPPRALEGWMLEASAELSRGSTLISRRLAKELDFSVGDTLLVKGGGTMTGGGPVYVGLKIGGIVDVAPALTHTSVGFVTHLRDVWWLYEQLNIVSEPTIEIDVWIDRDRLILPYDLAATRRNLASLQLKIDQVVRPYNATVSEGPLSTLQEFESLATGARNIILALSVPVILLGLYLGAVAVDLNHSERRREFALLQTRGAGRAQLVTLLLFEATVGGIVAGFLGLLGGVVLSRILLAVVGMTGTNSFVGLQELIVTPASWLSALVMAVAFMAAVTYRSARRASELSVVEALRHTTIEETVLKYKPTLDMVLIGLGVGLLGSLWYSQQVGGGFILFVVGALPFALLPLAPALIIVGGSRLLTRGVPQVYTWAVLAVKPLTKGLHMVIGRNVALSPRRSANIAIILALGLAFTAFSVILFGSLQVHQERQVRASVGADLAVIAPQEVDDFEARLEAIAGVQEATQVIQLFASAPGSPSLFALYPEEFFSTTNPEAWYFEGLSPSEARELLSIDGNVLASKRYAEQFNLHNGDVVDVRGTAYSETGDARTIAVGVTLAGLIRGLPGVTQDAALGSQLFGSVATFNPLLQAGLVLSPVAEGALYLVDLSTGASLEGVKDALLDEGALRVTSYDEELERTASLPFNRFVFDFVGVELGFTVFILAVSLGFLTYASAVGRQIEFAAIAARGASRRQTAGLLAGESLSIGLVGFAGGSGIGIALALATIPLFQPIEASLVPFLPQVPLQLFVLMGVAAVMLLVSVVLGTLRLAGMEMARVLRRRNV